MKQQKWDSKKISDQKGKVVIVTGSSGGLGYETAKALANRNATVIVAVRNEVKGVAAVEKALEGKNAIMPCIVRGKGKRYTWSIGEVPLADVANVEKKMPRNFISRDGFGITDIARDYLLPLIAGEDYPSYKKGLPQYTRLKNVLVPKKLKKSFAI